MDSAALALRLWVVMVLVAALVGKLSGRVALREFRDLLVSVGVPRRLVAPTGTTVIGAEVAAVILGPWPVTGLAGMTVATGLFAILTGGVTIAVRRRVTASCRCFGGSGGQLRLLHVARNGVLTIAAAAAAIVSVAAPDRPVTVPAVTLCLVAAGVAAAVVVRCEDIAALFVDAPALAPRGVRSTGAIEAPEPAGRTTARGANVLAGIRRLGRIDDP